MLRITTPALFLSPVAPRVDAMPDTLARVAPERQEETALVRADVLLAARLHGEVR
jgi:hypothetical protein